MSVHKDESGRRMVPAHLGPDACAANPQSTIEAMTSHRFAVAAERVYDAWMNPTTVREWMIVSLKGFGLSGDVRRVEIDPTVGGSFCFSDLRNGVEMVHCGEYLKLDHPRRIVFTWIVGETVANQDPSECTSCVTLTIVPEGDGCLATMVHQMDAKWADYVSQTEKGWNGMLRAIETLLNSEVVRD